MTWRDYVTGHVTHHLVVVCDGRVEGEHPERVVAHWWSDDDGWHSWAGRPHGSTRSRADYSGTLRVGDSLIDQARCTTCGIDVQIRHDTWTAMITQLAGRPSLHLREIARSLS